MTLNRRQILAGAALIGAVRPRVSWAAKDPVRIGVPTALTGPYADLGNQVKREPLAEF